MPDEQRDAVEPRSYQRARIEHGFFLHDRDVMRDRMRVRVEYELRIGGLG